MARCGLRMGTDTAHGFVRDAILVQVGGSDREQAVGVYRVGTDRVDGVEDPEGITPAARLDCHFGFGDQAGAGNEPRCFLSVRFGFGNDDWKRVEVV